MIEVYGYLGVPPPHVRRACSEADLVVGAARVLAGLGVPENRRMVMGPVEPVIERLVEREATARVHAENVHAHVERHGGRGEQLTFQRGRNARGRFRDAAPPRDADRPADAAVERSTDDQGRPLRGRSDHDPATRSGRVERRRFDALRGGQRSATPVAEDRVVVLASGDPLFYGIVRRLRRAGLECMVYPGVSSVAATFASVGVPWDDAQIVSAHGLPLRPALAACRALPKVAVLTGPGHGIREIAGALADLERWYVLAERLGESDQRVRVFDGSSARDVTDVWEPNVLLVLDTPPGDDGTIGVPVPFAGGLRPMSDLVDGGTQGLSPAAQLIIGRHLPVMGHVVWAQGRIGAEVAVACARTGAAVFDFNVPAVAPSTDADLVVLDDPSRLADLTGRRPRIIVLVSGPDDAEEAAAAVDALGMAGPVAVEHLAVTDDDGAADTAYLTTIYVEQDAVVTP
ncbi:MAG: precorrin-6y C5,15-methyltransferase (decarboxylating) subunit CbiE [Dermatophilaceae bacterium]